MAVTQLASTSDVVAVLGRALTSDESARVGAILDKASELFRLKSGQQFTSGTSIRRLRVSGGKVRLPQRPVVSVTSVTDDDGTAVAYTRFDSMLSVDLPTGAFVVVNYSHGGTVPDVVRLCIAEIAKKVLLIDPNAAAGMSQHSESTGPFSEQNIYATWAQGGQTMLAPADEALALTYRWRGGSTIVQSYS